MRGLRVSGGGRTRLIFGAVICRLEIVMLWSKLFIPTLRANPPGEPFSRQLLQRAGYLRGSDRWLFLGRRSLRKIVAIARAEFDSASAQEMLLPDAAAFETPREKSAVISNSLSSGIVSGQPGSTRIRRGTGSR